jgi:hypothetical protein
MTHHLISRAMKQVAATEAPILPTVAATCVSFSCRHIPDEALLDDNLHPNIQMQLLYAVAAH